jgi:hypothetical protein
MELDSHQRFWPVPDQVGSVTLEISAQIAMRRACSAVPVETTGRLTPTDVDTMAAACVAGAGVAQVLALGIEHLIANGDLIEIISRMAR